MSGRLQDKIAIVTGAGCVGPGWGNGRATCVRFAEEGAKIFAVDRDLDSVTETVERVKAAGGEIAVQQCNVTDNEAVAAMVAACLKRYGHIDVLVNNVGGSAAGGPVEMAEDVWDAQVDSNLKSVFLTCKHVLPVMEKQKAGSIVNLASTSALRWTGAAQVGYAATKAGVIQLSRVVAVQYIRQWWRHGSPSSAPVAMSRQCLKRGSRAFRWASWATAAIQRTPCSTLPPTKPVLSPAQKSSWMAV